MSKQVDERIVSMQFDNKNFEKNVSNTMSTLDKFKQKLNLKGASKGLESVNTAAKKVDMNGLANGVETVRTKFSAMEVVGVTALANITNSAVNAGKRIVSALTIDPIKTGLSEYETKMNAIQVIKANTRKNYDNEADQMKDINEALAELNEYADRTIYNYTQMTDNVGKFVAQGLGAKEATKAVQGLANLAGASGASAQDMARATYQMSQALGGTIRKIDWNSLRNANMATTELKSVLTDFAKIEGIDIDGMIAEKGTFEDTLEKGWLTGELFTKAMNVYSDVYSEAELKAMGFNDAQVKNFKELAKMANEATTEVKTMSQLWDVLKETAQSGWTQTWELIIGDFDTAKAMFTKLQVYFSNIINKMSDFRNAIIESALGKNFKKLSESLKNILKPLSTTTDSVKGMMNGLKDYSVIVDEIIAGKWGTWQTRWDALTAAGYDWAHAQNLVNERLGDSTRHATKYTEATKAQAAATAELSKGDAKTLEHLIAMSDAQLKAKGFTDEQIASLRELEKVSNKLGIPIRELIANIDQIDGRWLMMEGFANIGRSIAGAFSAAKVAWQEIFNPENESMIEKISNVLFDIIAAFHKFSRSLLLTNTETGELNENGDKLKRTFKGIFAIFDILATLIGGPLKIGFKILTQLLGAFDLNILDLTAVIGDAIVKFRDWIDSTLDFTKVFEFIAPYVKKAVNAVREWVAETKPLEKAGEIFSKLGAKIKEAFVKIKDSEFGQVAKNIILGLVKGLKEGTTTVGKAIWNIGKTIITKICEVLGIHSPSTEFIEIGKNIIAGLIVGITSIKILSIVGNIAKVIGGLGSALDGVGDVFEGVGAVLKKSARGVNKILKSTAKVIKSFAKTLGSVGNLINAKALQTVAISIAILAGSVAVLALMDPAKVWSAVGVIVVLAGVLGGLMAAVNKFGASGPKGIKEAVTGVKEFGQLATALITIAGSLLMLAVALRIIGGMEWKELGVAAAGIVLLGAVLAGLMVMTKFSGKTLYLLNQTILSLAGAMLMLSVALRIIGKMEWSELGVATAGVVLLGVVLAGLIWATKLAGPFAGTIGKTLLAVSGAMLMLSVALRVMGGMEWKEFGVAAAGLGLLSAVVILLIAIVKKAGPNIAAVGKTLLAISGAMAILTITAKMIAGMEWGDIVKAAVGLVGLTVIVDMLVKVVKKAGPNVAAIGATLLAISGAMLLLTLTAKIISTMDWGDIVKAAVGLAGLTVIVDMLVKVVKKAGTDAPKIALTLLAVAAAIGILAGVAVLLSLVEIGALAKGIAAVGFLSLFMIGLIKATRGASDCMKNLIVMTAAIAVMAIAVGALSMIDGTKLLTATVALGAVMGMFAVMTLAAKNVNGSMGTLIVMTVAIGVLAGILYLLAQLPIEASLGAAAALTLLMIGLSVSLAVLSGIGKFAGDALLGVLALLAMAVPLLAFVGILALMQHIKNVMPSVMALITLTTAMTLLLVPLTIIGAFGMMGLPYLGVVALLAMAAPMLAFVGILALMQNIQNATQNALILVTLMTAMTTCLVAVSLVAPLALIAVGAIKALVLVMTEVGILLTAIGALVTKFPQLETFLDTGIPILEKIGYAIGSVLGNIVSGFAVSAMSGLPEMGMLLSQFMINATPFIIGAKMIDATAMDGVKSLAEVILILTAADVIQGLTSWLTGGSSITKFGEEIAAFGPSIKKFADSVIGIDATSVQAAATAAKALAEMTATIPNEGGVVGWFTGENSIAKFADELPNLGEKLKLFSDNVAGINTESITAASDAAKALADMTSAIPNEGGVAAWFAGENSISKFAKDLPGLGEGLKGFSDNVTGINTESVNAAVDAAKAIVAMSSEIPNEGGVVSWFTGDNSIAKFGSQLGDLGTAISTFATNVGDANVDNIDKAVRATKALSELLSTDVSKNTDVMEKFGKKLVDFGKKVSEFCKKMSGVKDSAITSAIDKFDKLKNMASTLSVDSIGSLTKFSDTLVDVAENGIKEFVSALNSKTVKSDANEALSDLVSDTADGIKTKSNKNEFKSAGKYLIEGLAEGIRANKKTATKAAQEVADAVESIIRSAWKINSPSKVFYKIALGVGEGIKYALGDSTSDVKNSARDLADTTSKGFGNAISKINDLFNGTFDTQPTIRPVLDLSDVRAGASSISSMFSGNRTLAISAPGVGAISASMTNRQNGNNNLASAINKLAKSNGKSGDTYNFNGFSYSEGSDVADAIHTLVRAAKMEGRT